MTKRFVCNSAVAQTGGALPVSEWLQLCVRIPQHLPHAAPAAHDRQPAARLDRDPEAGRHVPVPQQPGAGQQPRDVCGRRRGNLPQPAQHQPQQLRSDPPFPPLHSPEPAAVPLTSRPVFSALGKWEDIERLSFFPKLVEIKAQGIPLLQSYSAEHRHSLLLAQ